MFAFSVADEFPEVSRASIRQDHKGRFYEDFYKYVLGPSFERPLLAFWGFSFRTFFFLLFNFLIFGILGSF